MHLLLRWTSTRHNYIIINKDTRVYVTSQRRGETNSQLPTFFLLSTSGSDSHAAQQSYVFETLVFGPRLPDFSKI